MKTVAIIQARMGSTRLPGKVMKDLAGKTVLERVVERTRAIEGLDGIVIATTDKEQDDIIVKEAERLGVSHFRGSEQDVLDRYYQAARYFGAQVVVRITSDCPLLDPQVVSGMIAMFGCGGMDYLSNSLERTLPLGLDAEIFSFHALEQAWREGDKDYEREHVTPFIYLNPDRFRVRGLIWRPNMSHYRWTLDTEEDFRAISEIYGRLHQEGIFDFGKILALLKREPWIHDINRHVRQKKLGE